MCGVCSFMKKHEVQCFIVALFTLLTSIILITLSIMYLLPEENHDVLGALLSKLPMAEHSAPYLSTMTLLACSVWMVSAFILVAGVQRNYSGCVLFYFVYGIFFTLMLHVATLLLLVHQDWAFGLGIILISLLHFRGLVAVYQTYDVMQRGKLFGSDEELLVADEDTLPLPDDNV